MTLLVGTRDGVFRTRRIPFDDADHVLESGQTPRVRTFDGVEGVFAASESGLYRSTDRGRTWTRIELPEEAVWEAFITVDNQLYAGTQPAGLFESSDGGDSWREIRSIHRDLSRDLWRSAFGDARIRALSIHPAAPDRLFVGVEAGGLFVSEDAGKTWRKCRIHNQTDIHQIHTIDEKRHLVPCGRLSIYDRNHAAAAGGLYLTTDAGRSWTRLDESVDPSYFREVLFHDGRLYACGALTVPPEWQHGRLGADASLFESEDVGESFDEVSYPGGPDEIVLAFEPDGTRVLGGTASGSGGRVIYRDSGGEWRTAGTLPADIRSIAAV